LTELDGRIFIIELSPAELRGVLQDALKLVSADPSEVEGWWRQLTADQPRARP
jgi:hypothetical protein